ncbi:MAG TPA: aminotransferase class IV family protein [Anaerolineales bacterium]|nr:aminotransferase class IV family protein [Anaerolineales bacterium]
MAHTTFHAQLNGEPVDPDALHFLALVNYGHFTSMQVRQGAVRGLRLHLERLARSTRELLGTDLEAERVRDLVRHALPTPAASASVRVTVFSRLLDFANLADPAGPDVLVSVRPPLEAERGPLRVVSVTYERVLPHIKHVGTFGLFHQTRRAQSAGYDDALFLTAAGSISEGSVWNVGFYDGTQVVLPSAPALDGVTQRLLISGLDRLGRPWKRAVVRLSDLPGFVSAFAMNSVSAFRPIAQIDDITFKIDAVLEQRLAEAYTTNDWDTI